ncbi:type II toxin-antitoxin system HipA family toxin [soil metagenome]
MPTFGVHKSAITMAEVRLHLPSSTASQRVGWLSEVGDSLRLSFDPEYVGNAGRLTLSQLYRGATAQETVQILNAVNDERLVRVKLLPAFFSNLLPEGRNRERLAQRRGCDVTDELNLLAAAGHDLSGAVEVLPGLQVPSDVLELHVTQHLDAIEPLAVAAPLEDGFSVDGFQTKFSAVQDGERYVVRSGDTAGSFLAKLPYAQHPDVVRNEATCYRLAAAVGMNTAQVSVEPIDKLDVPDSVKETFDQFLLVRRFDRVALPDGLTGRIHFEELTQALGIDARHKYRNLEGAMRALLVMLKSSDASGQQDIDEFFRRWTVNALMGNTDAHAKNWGLLYPDGIHPVLAPAYDLVCVAAYFDPLVGMRLATNERMDRSLRMWGEDAAEALAKSANLLTFNRVRKVVRDTQKLAAATWPALLQDAPLSVRETILERLRSMVRAPIKPARLERQ